jgi:YHS domain-containing protein
MKMSDIALLLISFLIGGLCALVARSALHKPYEQPMTMPSAEQERKSAAMTDQSDHASHAGHQTKNHPVTSPTINSICSICGMDVDSEVPTAQYQGKTIGFGCRKCPPLFAKDPDRYGPFYLKNEKMPK